MPVYTAADWNYRAPLYVMLASMARHWTQSGPLPVFVLTPADDVGRFQNEWGVEFRQLAVRFVAIDASVVSQLPIYGHTGMMTYSRLLLEDRALCPWDRVLYLDADILVRGDLSELLCTVVPQATAIAGVRECGTSTVAAQGGVFNWQELGLDPQKPYINAGVLGLNLEVIRETKLFSRALAYLAKHGRMVVNWDQGAINAVVGRDVSLWSSRYNFTTSYLNVRSREKLERLLGEPCADPTRVIIAHFTGSGSRKPWHVNSVSPFAAEYKSYLDPTKQWIFPEGNTRLEKLLGNRLAGFIRKALS